MQSSDTTTGELPAQVMVSVFVLMSKSMVATTVPAAFFTVVVPLIAEAFKSTVPAVVKQTAEPFFIVLVAVSTCGLLRSIAMIILTPLL
jgi:hypothetical protein